MKNGCWEPNRIARSLKNLAAPLLPLLPGDISNTSVSSKSGGRKTTNFWQPAGCTSGHVAQTPSLPSGLSAAAVRNRVQASRLPSLGTGRDCHVRSATGSKIAELTGRTVKNVRHKRLKLGIPFFNPEFRPWTRAEDKLLGTMPAPKWPRG